MWVFFRVQTVLDLNVDWKKIIEFAGLNSNPTSVYITKVKAQLFWAKVEVLAITWNNQQKSCIRIDKNIRNI